MVLAVVPVFEYQVVRCIWRCWNQVAESRRLWVAHKCRRERVLNFIAVLYITAT